MPSLHVLPRNAYLRHDADVRFPVGDRGFDPLGLSKPVEYLQYDVDGLDQNLPKNRPGAMVGTFTPSVDQVSQDSLQPYSEVGF